MSYRVIFIPGLGDKNRFLVWLQRRLLRNWKRYGVTTELFTVGWTSKDDYAAIYQKLLEKVDTYVAEGAKVIVIGASAGASTAISTLADRPQAVHGVVTVVGQLAGRKEVIDAALELNPRFSASLAYMTKSIPKLTKRDLQRILCIRGKADSVVPVDDQVLDGAAVKTIPSSEHLFSIGYSLLHLRRIIRPFVV